MKTTNGNEQLSSLVTRLESRNNLKRDFVSPASAIEWTPDGSLIVKATDEQIFYKPTDLFKTQIAEKLSIPMPYFRKMEANVPALLSSNINGWLEHKNRDKYLVRGLDQYNGDETIARAFLSSNYNIIDDYEVLFSALEAIKNSGVSVEITKAEISDNKMALHVVCPEVENKADAFLREYLKENDAVGNGIISGFVITNSETGKGAFEVRPRAVIVKCNNGLVVKDDRFRRIHLGGKMDAGQILWSEKTQKKNQDLVISQVSDAVKTFLSPQYLGTMVERLERLHNIELNHPIDAVQNVCKKLTIDEDHKANILDYFLRDGSHNVAGIFHAVTRESQFMELEKQDEVENHIFELMSSHKTFDIPVKA